MISKQQKILNVISQIRNSHVEMKNIFLNGSCLNFFCILRTIFPEAKAYFNIDHVITKIDNTFYDINGIVYNTKNYLPYTSYYNKKRTSRSFIQMFNYNYKIKNNANTLHQIN